MHVHFVDIGRETGSVRFEHCPREPNGAPHEIATYYYYIKNVVCNCNWIDEPFLFLFPKLINDVLY